MNPLVDLTFTLFRYPPRPLHPSFGLDPGTDLGPLVLLEGLGTVNRAIERDLLSFRTGDFTLVLRNGSGQADELFSDITPEDRWTLKVERGGETMFTGVVLGQGSIEFDRKERTCAVTAYGPTRILSDISAEPVRRPLVDRLLSVNHAAGAKVLQLDGDPGPVQNGDEIRVTDHITKGETLIVGARNTPGGSAVRLTTALSNAFDAGTAAELDRTPYYRFKTVKFLVEQLLAEAKIPLVEFLLSAATFRLPAPAPTSRNGLLFETLEATPDIYWPGPNITKKGTNVYVIVGDNSNVASEGRFRQALGDPSGDWTLDSGEEKNWVDWSRYRTLDEGEPATHLKMVFPWNSNSVGTPGADPFIGYDFDSSPFVAYLMQQDASADLNPTQIELRKLESSDGLTWSAAAGSPLLTVASTSEDAARYYDCEFDPGRDQVWITYSDPVAGKHTKIWDVAGGALVGGFDLTTDALFGLVYVKEWDAIVGWKNDRSAAADNYKGPWTLVAYRGTTKLWERSGLPQFGVRVENIEKRTGTFFQVQGLFPTKNLRVYRGVAMMIMLHDQTVTFLQSEDQFVTFTKGALTDSSSVTWMVAGTDGTGYRFIAFESDKATLYGVADTETNKVVSYADFERKSVGEALAALGVLVNAVAWVDDDMQAHFVSRDLFSVEPTDITGLVTERSDIEVWDQVRQFVEVSGPGGVAGFAGDPDFASDPISISNEFVPNGAYANGLAQVFADFFEVKRRMLEVTVRDDGHIYRPLDRVTLDGFRYMVYESDHDLVGLEHVLKLLEDP